LYSREGRKVLSCWYNCDAFVRYFPLCPGTGGR